MGETIETKAPQYLSFTVAGTAYGIPVLSVKEILQHEEPTRVPGSPPSIRGVINVRGQVVPVVDLALKFGHTETVATKRTCILVVESGIGGERLVLGVLADAVNEVLDLPSADVEETPSFGTDVRVEYLTGVGKVGRDFVLLLDLDRVLSASEAEVAASSVRGADAAGAGEAPDAVEVPPPPDAHTLPAASAGAEA
jgi:chemotaxis signal transduction protein